MARLFVTGNDVRIKAHDKIFIDAEMFTGEKYLNLEPRRLFPVTGVNDYISFLDENGDEKFILKHISDLPEDQQEILQECLREYYRIPKITKILNRNDNSQVFTWTVETDRGVFTFQINSYITGIKQLYDKRILITDSKDNRYEIPDINKLDPKSRKSLMREL